MSVSLHMRDMFLKEFLFVILYFVSFITLDGTRPSSSLHIDLLPIIYSVCLNTAVSYFSLTHINFSYQLVQDHWKDKNIFHR